MQFKVENIHKKTIIKHCELIYSNFDETNFDPFLNIKNFWNNFQPPKYFFLTTPTTTNYFYFQDQYMCAKVCFNFSKISERANVKLSTGELHSGVNDVKITS